MTIDKKDIEKLRTKFLKDHSELGKVINPILEKYTLSYNELVEVCQIGKFACKIDSDLSIIEKPKPPNPDFLIQHNSKQIGLEHTRIQTENAHNYNKIITLLNYAETIYRIKYPLEKVHAIIFIENDTLKYKPHDKKLLAEQIATAVFNVQKQISNDKPSFISSIKTTSHSQVSFSYKEKNWAGPYLTNERLLLDIKKKEEKVRLYQSNNTNIEELWLVLLIGSLNSASYQLNEQDNYKADSIFDRVYLMTDFEAEIFRVK